MLTIVILLLHIGQSNIDLIKLNVCKVSIILSWINLVLPIFNGQLLFSMFSSASDLNPL